MMISFEKLFLITFRNSLKERRQILKKYSFQRFPILFLKNKKEPAKVDYEDVQNFYDSIRAEVVDPNDLEHKVFSNLLDDDLMTALNSLQDDYKTVVILCDLEGLSYEEIAEFLDCPIGTVRSRIRNLNAKSTSSAKKRVGGILRSSMGISHSFTSVRPT